MDILVSGVALKSPTLDCTIDEKIPGIHHGMISGAGLCNGIRLSTLKLVVFIIWSYIL
jgi:hypothetical protein